MAYKLIEAKFNVKKRNALIISIILFVLAIAVYLLLTYVSEQEYYEDLGYREYVAVYNLLGDRIWHGPVMYAEEYSVGFHPIKFMGDFIYDFIIIDPFSKSGWLAMGVCVCLIIALSIIFILISSKIVSKRCVLSLDDIYLIGRRVKLFTKKEVKLPMDKIDNITIQHGFYDKLFGGQTIAIRSVSGTTKFPWVHNAQEFVDKTLAEIQKYNEVAEIKTQLTSAPTSSLSEKLQELQSLKEQGILTEEQFEQKKQELIAKF